MTPRDYNGLLRDDQARRESAAFGYGLAWGIGVGCVLCCVAFALGMWWFQ